MEEIKNLSKEELEEKFENFLFNIEDYLESIIDKANSQDYVFDYTLNSLKDVESYIIKNNTTIDDDDYNDLSAYLGEVLRLTYGGKWICNLDEINNSLYYGFPVIEGHSVSGVLFSPFHIVRAFILRRKTNLFCEAIESQVHPQEIDWSKFSTK
jgi:hypothetical protein